MAYSKFVQVAPDRLARLRCLAEEIPLTIASKLAADPCGAIDPISDLKALPDCRMHREFRFPQYSMLLAEIISNLSLQVSLVGMEHFASRHRQRFSQLLGNDRGKSPSELIFRLLEALQLDGVLQQIELLHANNPFPSASPSAALTSRSLSNNAAFRGFG